MLPEEISERLLLKGVKPTANRILVYATLAQEVHPLSQTELVEALHTLDKSSVCRVLTLFADHNVVHSIDDGSGCMKYELCSGTEHHTMEDSHVHFYCHHCHRIYCFNHIAVPQTPLPPGYETDAINYVVKGLCPHCAQHKHTH